MKSLKYGFVLGSVCMILAILFKSESILNIGTTISLVSLSLSGLSASFFFMFRPFEQEKVCLYSVIYTVLFGVFGLTSLAVIKGVPLSFKLFEFAVDNYKKIQ